MAHGALTPIIALRLLALAAGLRHNAEIGQPGLCFSAYGRKFGINHLAGPAAQASSARRQSSLARQGETGRVVCATWIRVPADGVALAGCDLGSQWQRHS